jgi:hypothetical protein
MSKEDFRPRIAGWLKMLGNQPKRAAHTTRYPLRTAQYRGTAFLALNVLVQVYVSSQQFRSHRA